ncbi:hypothetical protein ACP6PL_22370 [Dapis sp. BLCC M126]
MASCAVHPKIKLDYQTSCPDRGRWLSTNLYEVNKLELLADQEL